MTALSAFCARSLRLGLFALGTALLPAMSQAAAPFPLKGEKAAASRQSNKDLGRRKLAPGVSIARGSRVKVAFFDADSTLRESASGQLIAANAADVKLLPKVAGRIKQLNKDGYLVAIVSNQGGVGKNTTMADADGGLAQVAKLLAKRGARVDYYDFAEKQDIDRKPGNGMALRLESLLSSRYGATIDKQASMMVGDAGYKRADKNGPADVRPDGQPGTGTDFSNSDRGFADSYGVRFEHAPGYFVAKPTK
jgi:bifunctional polynucleotide phosphatase/kinase